MKNIFRYNAGVSTICIISSFLLVSCFGGGGKGSSELTSRSSSDSKQVNSNSNRESANSDLNCRRLDPGKIYMMGTLKEGNSYDVLFDPENPSQFCVGFDEFHTGVITENGELFYGAIQAKSIYAFAPDELSWGTDGKWIYPKEPDENDRLLLTIQSEENCFFEHLSKNPVSGELVYTCGDHAIHTESDSNYFNNDRHGDFLGIMPDGSLLIDDLDGLKLIAGDMTETSLDLPASVDGYIFSGTSRIFINPETGHKSVWIIVQHGSNNDLSCLSLDLANLKITDEGMYAARPASVTGPLVSGANSMKLDDEGRVWQIGSNRGGYDVIFKRPLLSTGDPSTVVYSEDDAEENSNGRLVAKMHGGRFVTGWTFIGGNAFR